MTAILGGATGVALVSAPTYRSSFQTSSASSVS